MMFEPEVSSPSVFCVTKIVFGVRAPPVVFEMLAPATVMLDLPTSDKTVSFWSKSTNCRKTVPAFDVVIAVVGYSEDEEGEGQIAAGDREFLTLPEDDLALLGEATTLNNQVIAVVITGSAFTTTGWGDEVATIVVAW